MGPRPAVAEIRNAVRDSLQDLGPGDLVLAACSGGADSLSLAAALAFVAPRQRLRAGAVTVDHGLQAGSAERARAVAATLTGLGLDPVECVPVTVPRGGAHGGPEAAARTARYAALDDAAQRTGASVVLLGHTLDDQAETVLLGLARGSGPRALAGMAARRGHYRRPLLAVRRGVTADACAALGLGCGTIRTTLIPGSPGSGSGSRRCRCWRQRWAPAWPRPWPGPRDSCAPTPTISTRWPPWRPNGPVAGVPAC